MSNTINEWEEEFDKFTVFSAPMPKDNNVHTFVVDIQEVKDFIVKLLTSERAKLIKEIEDEIKKEIGNCEYSCLGEMISLLNSLK
jgi:hypothetical protein